MRLPGLPGPPPTPPPPDIEDDSVPKLRQSLRDLEQTLGELEEWAVGNKRSARRDAISFWILKVPAIFASASAGVWAHFNFVTTGIVAGAIASVCVVIDGIHPRGMLRNVHLRAVHDIRNLEAQMVAKWRGRNKFSNGTDVVGKIIRDAEPERTRIAEYIRDAETALKFDKHP